MVIEIDQAKAADLVQALNGDFYIDEQSLRRAVDDRSTANAIHHATSGAVRLNVVDLLGRALSHAG
jgi:hypothetical protein